MAVGDPQGSRGDAGELHGTGSGLRRRRNAQRRPEPGFRRACGNFRLSDPASGDPQDFLHGLDCGGQASRSSRRQAHEALHHGAWRTRAGDCVRGRRHRRRGPDPFVEQVPQRRPDLRGAVALSRSPKRLREFRRKVCPGGRDHQGRRRFGRGYTDGAAGQHPPPRRDGGDGGRRTSQREAVCGPAAIASAIKASSSSRQF